MADNSSKEVAQYAVLEPSDRITFGAGNSVSTMYISNNSPTKNIVFKIRTTQPLCYVVKPNSGIIEAKGKARIDINFVPNDTVTNIADSKFQVQIAFTDLKSNETDKLTDFYQYLQKSQIHAVKLPVKMEQAPSVASEGGPGVTPEQGSEVFASAVEGVLPQRTERQDTARAMVQPNIAPAAPQQQFEKAPTSDVNNEVMTDSNVQASSVFKSTVAGTSKAELQSQVLAYQKMIEKEQSEIKKLKESIQKTNSNISKTPAAGAQDTPNWNDNQVSSGKKFKFVHLIIVAIIFLLLGSYLAKIPLAATASSAEQQKNN